MRFVLLAALLISTPAWAVDLTVDLNKPILAADGQTKKECVKADEKDPKKCAETRDVTFGNLAMEVLSQPDPALRGDQKVKVGALGVKFAEAKGTMTLTLDEANILKQQADSVLVDPILVYRVHQVIDPASK